MAGTSNNVVRMANSWNYHCLIELLGKVWSEAGVSILKVNFNRKVVGFAKNMNPPVSRYFFTTSGIIDSWRISADFIALGRWTDDVRRTIAFDETLL